MSKSFKKTYYIFLVVLFSGFIYHLLCIFVPNAFEDESYYITVPLRLINGESLIQHEWNLTEFSSLFTYLPVYLWIKIKGSTEGIILFLRCVYLLVHTSVSVTIYNFFKEHGYWAIAATMMFYLHIPYNMYAVSYCSTLIIFLLLLMLCFLSIYGNPSKKTYVASGLCFGACCVSNPVFCFCYFIYIIFCFLWFNKEKLFTITNQRKKTQINKKKKRNRKRKEKAEKDKLVKFEKINNFFSKDAILFSFIGIAIIAVISIIFFFSTGGTISSLFRNLPNLLGSSDYSILKNPLTNKFDQFWTAVNDISFNMPWLLPLLFIAVLADKKRYQLTHRLTYLSLSFSFTILYVAGIIKMSNFKTACFSFPFAIFSITCYILTQNKNTVLFYLLWCPCAFAAVLGFLTSNTVLLIIATIFSISNIAGVLFAKDLLKEIVGDTDKKTLIKAKKNIRAASCLLIISSILFQFGIYMKAMQYCPSADLNTSINKITVGPYKEAFMFEEKSSIYEKQISDLDLIKKRSNIDDPVLITGYENWFYLYIDRPFATYTAWDQEYLNKEYLINYYKENNNHIPKYIYIANSNINNQILNTELLSEIFYFTEEQLSRGVLLTVTGCVFDFNTY